MNKPNWKNRTLYQGDNLDFMRAMNSNSVHLIATDPPFNKGRDFHAIPTSLSKGASFHDRWRWDKDTHEEWHDQLQDDWPGVWAVIDWTRVVHSDAMAAFLCYMAVRLIEMHRILREDGSIYLHCDPTASHYLKTLMDGVYGEEQFRNEIIWRYDGPQRPSKRNFGRKHDVILRYSKADTYYSSSDGIMPSEPIEAKELKKYKQLSDGQYYYTTPRGDYTDQSIERLKREDRVEYTKTGNVRIRHFLSHNDDNEIVRRKQLPDVWSDIVSVGHAGGRERMGYPTQKPLALYQRIIKASSKEEDFVFDPFAGCATTPIAAEKESRQWVACDLWSETLGLVERRLARDVKVGDVGVLPYYPIHHLQKHDLPERTDGGETAVDYLEPPTKRQKEPWERLSKQRIAELLAEAQSTNDGMTMCAGCGRELEREFMELDHIQPRRGGGTNDITNRILLCGPCNGRKSARYTLPGLQDENRKTKWMRDKRKAEIARENARRMAEKVRKGEIG